jgi:competence protein ComEC
VVRAGVLVQLVCLAWLFRRRASFLNSLGCAGIVVVLLNPISLFSPGTHLSFLAVLALGVAAPSWHRRPVTDPLDRLIWRTRPAWWHAVRALFHRTLRLVGASAMVWLVTLPLIAYHFHLVSPIAIPLNVVLAVPLATSLLSGMVLVMTGGWLEPVAIPMAVICEGSLQLLRHIINRAALLPGGYFWCAGPGSIAVSCFYILLSMGWMFAATPRARVTVGGIALTVFGLLWLSQDTIFRESRSSLRATFLSVGHGVCVVLQFPNGETWLYDAGRLGNPRIAVDWVSQFLWKQRVTHLDRIVISHVDIDHYSLVPGLLKRFSVAEMGMTGYCQPESMNAQYALSRLFADHGVPKRILRAGWERQVGSCTIQVLQPWQRWPDASDNAHSLVLCVSFAGRHLLLPGDLEGRGLDSLLQRHMPPIDAAMLPHHGSLRSEPVRFAEWAQSGILVVSGGDVQAAADLNAQFRGLGIRLFSTARDGAVTLELCPTGEVRVKSFRDRDARQ